MVSSTLFDEFSALCREEILAGSCILTAILCQENRPASQKRSTPGGEPSGYFEWTIDENRKSGAKTTIEALCNVQRIYLRDFKACVLSRMTEK